MNWVWPDLVPWFLARTTWASAKPFLCPLSCQELEGSGVRRPSLKLSELVHLKMLARSATGARNQGPLPRTQRTEGALGSHPFLVLTTGILQVVGLLHTLYMGQVCVTVEKLTWSPVHKAGCKQTRSTSASQGDTVLIILVRKYLPSTWRRHSAPLHSMDICCRHPWKLEAGQKLSPDT